MKITNNHNLPQAILKAVQNDSYHKGEKTDYSVTDLLKPPRQLTLMKLFKDEITEDAADMIYRLYGQIVHSILDRANDSDLSEERFFAEFLGKTISGQIDSLSHDGRVLTDFKFATAWKFKQNAAPDFEFVAQLNMQLELLRQNGLDARRLQVVGLIRDFHLREAEKYPDSYPKSPIVVLDIPMWHRRDTVEFIETRIRLHENAWTDLPECTKDERWAEDDIHAVMKGTRAMSGGLKTNHEQALQMHRLNPGSRIEFRPAVNKRCTAYCAASRFCAQYQKLKLSKV